MPKRCTNALGCHENGLENPFARGSVSSVCMHYGGLVGDHTTASMVVSLEGNRTVVWSTGSTTPCVSLFKPWLFGTEEILPVVCPRDKEGERYWLEAEKFRRSLLGKKLPAEYYTQRSEIQQSWIDRAREIADSEFPAFSRACLAEEHGFYEQWKTYSFENATSAPGFLKRWEKKNKALFSSSEK